MSRAYFFTNPNYLILPIFFKFDFSFTLSVKTISVKNEEIKSWLRERHKG